jgi:hypothetical protein
MAVFDVPKDNRQQYMSSVASRLATMGMHLPDHLVESGKRWYPEVHETVKAQAPSLGISASQGAGIVAAVSPNMDFDNRNIKALEQIGNIDKSGWDMIYRSASRRTPDNRQMKRIPEVTEMLREVAPSLNSSYDASLVNAHRIMHGEQWRDVLTGPKTFRFAGNIENPFEQRGVTVDGRHHDIVANAMYPWTDFERGISSFRKSRPTRYEDIESVTSIANKAVQRRDSRFAGALDHDLQAILWLGGKFIETQGGVYQKGPARTGQPYTTARGTPLKRDKEFWQS